MGNRDGENAGAVPPVSKQARNQRHKDAVILALLQDGGSSSTESKHLRKIAGMVTDFQHFQSLCTDGMRAAWERDQKSGKRDTSNQVARWRRVFRYFAVRTGIGKDVQIHAINRSGGYACTLIDKVPPKVRGGAWGEFVQMGALYGIREAELDELARKGERRLTGLAAQR